MPLKVMLGLFLTIGIAFSASITNKLKPLDLTPYGLDGVGFLHQDAAECLIELHGYWTLKSDLARLQNVSTGLEMALSNQSEQTRTAISLSDTYKLEALKQKQAGESKGLIGLLIGGGGGLVLGTVAGILICNAVKK